MAVVAHGCQEFVWLKDRAGAIRLAKNQFCRIKPESRAAENVDRGGGFIPSRGGQRLDRLRQGFADAGEQLGEGDGTAILGPGCAIHAHKELAVRKYGALELDFEIFIPVKILDRNSQVCFHRTMITGMVIKTNRARFRAQPVA